MTESEKRERRKVYDARWKMKNPDYKPPYRPEKAREKYLEKRGHYLARANARYRNMTPEQREEHNRKRRERHARQPEVRNRVERVRDHKKRAGGKFNWNIWDIIKAKYSDRCLYCDSSKNITIEHRQPVSRGGDNGFHNLAPACLSCNSSKRNKPEQEYREWRAQNNLHLRDPVEVDYYFLY